MPKHRAVQQRSANTSALQRRGEEAAATRRVKNEDSEDMIAVAPSIIFGGEEDAGARTPVQQSRQDQRPSEFANLSPVPSQILLESTQGGGAAGGAATARLPRQRPRFHTVQDLDLALNQAIEGKINSKNAWASKEASDLLEGITHTIENTLDTNQADDYSGFTKAATVVEGCSKVWTIRVDSTYNQSNQMLQRLLRNEDVSASQRNATDNGEEDGEEGEEGGGGEAGAGRRRRAAAGRALARTLALNASEINLDSKGKTALTQSGINAQFRAITEKFDQGNAQGLLLHNAPLGAVGNLILDVDYGKMTGVFSAKKAKQQMLGSNQTSTRTSGAVKKEGEEEEADGNGSVAQGGPSPRLSAAVEQDAAAFLHLDDLPDFVPPAVSAVDLSSSMLSNPRPSHVPHPASVRQSELLPPVKAEPRGSAMMFDAFATEAQQQQQEQNGLSGDGINNDYDDDDNFGGGDWGDDEDQDFSHDEGGDVGEAARQMVSGAAEMQAMDALFSTAGAVQLALEAEDPSSWCPLNTTQTNNPLATMAPRSELSRLRKEHKLTQQQPSSPNAADGGQPAAKRAKKDRTVVFDLNEVSTDPSSPAGSPATFLTEDSIKNSTALKQSTTKTKNVTALGREILLGKDATHAVMLYTQSGFQRAKAEQSGLILPAAPVPGETIPSYAPYPIDVADFFQPFSTALPQWNLLRKSAAGSVIANSHSPRGSFAPHLHGEDGERILADMPVDAVAGARGVDDYDGDDYNDFYGGDDNDAEEDYRHEHQRILAQFEAVEAAAAAAVTNVSSTRTSGAASGQQLQLMAPLDLAKVLQAPEAVLPTQVDVVRLRQVMWEALQNIIANHPKLAAHLENGLRDPRVAPSATSTTTHNKGRKAPKPAAEGMLKAHARALLANSLSQRQATAEARRKRARDEEEEDDEEEEEKRSSEGEGKSAAHARSAQPSSRRKADSDSGEDEEDEEEEVPLPTFSDVVQAVLPLVPTISSTGVLSPSFFFFSILFLANEHNVVLDNVEALNDLTVRGLATKIH